MKRDPKDDDSRGVEIEDIESQDGAELDGSVEELPLLPLRNAVLFPSALMPIVVGRPKTVELLQHVETHGGIIAVLTQRDKEVEEPTAEDFYEYGTAARILKVMRGDDETYHVIVQGLRRFRCLRLTQEEPFLMSNIEWVPDFDYDPADPALQALGKNIKETGRELIALIPDLPEGAAELVAQIDDPGRLLYLVMAHLGVPVEEKVQILSEVDVGSALRRTLELLHHQIEVLHLSNKINREVKGEMDRNQREFVLRQQLKAIQRELGELEGAESDLDDLEDRLMAKELPEEARQAVEKEFRRLRMLQPASPEYGVARTWLEWISDLPFTEVSIDRLDIEKAREILDEDHYDLEKVKKRILEYIAVRKLNPDLKGPILCLVGPPGVGKTSLGESIARSLGRKFVRVSLGGVRDEAEIRGHRRTYVGAMPGKFIQQLRRVDVINPVMMLDEVDKVGRDWRGDPTSALLEVLDPEQNHNFMDHYLDIPYDLSNVMFLATANQTDTIPSPLLDRMEVIHLPGYTYHEKVNIARKHLISRQIEKHGLTEKQFRLPDESLSYVIHRYTREAGVRSLERRIADLCRQVAVRVVNEEWKKKKVDVRRVKKFLGVEQYNPESADEIEVSGVATGMAWTPTGGDILFVEATKMPGKGRLRLTGKLGDVMKESAEIAVSLLKARFEDFGIDPVEFSELDVHVHVPSGAIPKDGPSAGVTLFTALVSLFTDIKVRGDVAMTGEVTLRGLVTPVGGIKEKVLATLRAGISEIILPERNRKDLQDIPDDVRAQLKFHFVQNVEQVLTKALSSKIRRKRRASSALPTTTASDVN
ncbi:MAG: endopeptidase La [Myxococcales bacterium]|nr:endopeptidase La [Myxococcales bacterium]